MLLFMMVGMALLALPLSWAHVTFAAAAIVCALVGRVTSVTLPMSIVARTRPLAVGTIQALVWGGVRGGVSLAMALALPETPYKPYLVTGTWAVVMFSLLVQVPTMGHVLRHYGLTAQKE
jgi:CPA1 family monovalent cation:H+ antiporter